MKAILLPYCVEQNEPSKPVSILYEVPDDKDQRDKELRELFNKHVCELDDEDLANLSIKECTGGDYGDIVVAESEFCSDLFLFVTYVT